MSRLREQHRKINDMIRKSRCTPCDRSEAAFQISRIGREMAASVELLHILDN